MEAYRNRLCELIGDVFLLQKSRRARLCRYSGWDCHLESRYKGHTRYARELGVDRLPGRRLNLGQGDRIHRSFVGLLFLAGHEVRKEISQHAEKSQPGNAVGRKNPRAATCKASGG